MVSLDMVLHPRTIATIMKRNYDELYMICL